MSNTDWAFGFAPYGILLRARYYAIVTAPTINFYHQDVVGNAGAHLQTPKYGYLPSLAAGAVIDGKDNLLGSVIALFDSTMDPVKYIAPATVGNGTIAGYALVADHPNQEFLCREDFDANAIDVSEGSLNGDIISVSLSAGNSKTGISRQMIDSSSVAATAALNLKIHGPHPNDVDLVSDDTPGSSGDEGARWIVTILEHYYVTTGVDGGASA